MSLIHTCELDAHGSVRLPHRASAARKRAGDESVGVDALELPPTNSARPNPLGLATLRYPAGNAHKTPVSEVCFHEGFWPPLSVALYARVSTHDQQTLPLQIPLGARYQRPSATGLSSRKSKKSAPACRNARCETSRSQPHDGVKFDVVLVWRLDRWGRSVADLVATLQELQHLGVGFVSLTEALDLTTPAGRAMAGLLRCSPSSNAKIRESAFVPAWITHASKANASAVRRLWLKKPWKPGNYIGKESANPKSHASSRSAEPPSAASWPQKKLESARLTQPCRMEDTHAKRGLIVTTWRPPGDHAAIPDWFRAARPRHEVYLFATN